MIARLEMTVTDGHLSWRLEERDGEEADSPTVGGGSLDLRPRRRANLTMLSDLLRHAEDGTRRDALSSDLYRDLLRVVGHELFDLLFYDPALRNKVAIQLTQLRDRKVALFRIVLSFDGDHSGFLAGLPWEYICTPVGDEEFGPQGVFLAQTAELVLSRHLQIARARTFENTNWPVRVLLIASSPNYDPDDEHHRTLNPVVATQMLTKLTELDQAGYIDLHQLVEDPHDHPVEGHEWQVTRQAVIDKVREIDPTILHFLGHGRNFRGAGHLAFAFPNGAVDWIPDSEFADLINRAPSFNLAFLQACESALPDPYVSFSGVANHLAGRGLPAVVAMQYRVRSSIANQFASKFYDALLIDRLPVDHAVERGRESILGRADPHERMSFGLPVVYLSTYRGLGNRQAQSPEPHRALVLDRNDVEDVVACVRCGEPIRNGDKVCRWCGLRRRCSQCGHTFGSPEAQRFCETCGESLNQSALDEDKVKRPVGSPDEVTAPARATLNALRGADAG